MKKSLFLLFFVFLLCLVLVSAFELPENIQKIIAYNNEQAVYYLAHIGYFVAFLAGLLALLSPCTFAIIPMYFSYGFKERSTFHTFAFFLGFTTIFVLLGMLASALGQSILLLQSDYSFVILLAGILLVVLGVLEIFGRGFSVLPLHVFHARNVFGSFLLGVLFAFGWTACTGPILAGVLLIAGVLGSYLQAGILMFFYALGNFVPFFLLSFAVDGFRWYEHPWIKGKTLSFSLFGEKFQTHSTSILSGLLLLFMGGLFIFFRDTSLFNRINIYGANLVGYSLQKGLLSSSFAPLLGGVLFLTFVCLLLYFLLRKKR